MAIQIRRPGGPEVLEYVEIDVPEPGPGEVAIQVGAAGVNFIDIYHRQGVYPMPLPFVPGREGAGRVIAIGRDVDRRRGRATGWPGCRSRAPTPRSRSGRPTELIPVPDALSDEQAAALALQGLTAQSLATDVTASSRRHRADPCRRRRSGTAAHPDRQDQGRRRVITTVSTPDKAELSRAAGADEVLIGYDGFAAKAGISPTAEGCRRCTTGSARRPSTVRWTRSGRRGTMVLFGGASGQVPPFDIQRLNKGGSLKLTRPNVDHFVLDPRRTAGSGHGCLRLGRPTAG